MLARIRKMQENPSSSTSASPRTVSTSTTTTTTSVNRTQSTMAVRQSSDSQGWHCIESSSSSVCPLEFLLGYDAALVGTGVAQVYTPSVEISSSSSSSSSSSLFTRIQISSDDEDEEDEENEDEGDENVTEPRDDMSKNVSSTQFTRIAIAEEDEEDEEDNNASKDANNNHFSRVPIVEEDGDSNSADVASTASSAFTRIPIISDEDDEEEDDDEHEQEQEQKDILKADTHEKLVIQDQKTPVQCKTPAEWKDLGNSYFMKGKLFDALEAFTQSIHLDPGFLPSRNNRAQVNLQLEVRYFLCSFFFSSCHSCSRSVFMRKLD